MTLKDTLNADLKTAMKASDEARRSALRLLLAGVKQAELDKRAAAAKLQAKGGELSDAAIAELEKTSLDDAEVLNVIQREAKARRESIADAEKAGRPEAVAENQAALTIIEAYLPKQLSRAELVTLAQAAIAEAGVSDLKQQGAVMKLLGPRTKGLADGKLVNEVVRELLGG